MEVFEPPLVSLTVPDKKYTNAVEACFNANQLKVCCIHLGDVVATCALSIRLS